MEEYEIKQIDDLVNIEECLYIKIGEKLFMAYPKEQSDFVKPKHICWLRVDKAEWDVEPRE